MHIKATLLIGAMALFELTSCIKDVTLELPEHSSKFVLNSILTPDSLFKVYLSKSVRITESSNNTSVNDAVVIIKSDQNFMDTLIVKGNGIYESIINKPMPNKKYSISVNHPLSDALTAEESIPQAVPIGNSSGYDYAGYDSDGRPYSQIQLTLADPAGEVNYYEVMVIIEYPDITVNNVTYKSKYIANINTNNPTILAEGDTYYGSQTFLFKDASFDGKFFNLVLDYFYPSLQNGQIPVNKKIYLKLNTCSKSYYEYKKRLIRHLAGQNLNISGIDGIFSGQEPIQMYSNVNNGFGVFVGYSSDIDTLIY